MAAFSGLEPTGLIIGKFMPPHLGHLYLVEQARSRVEQLTVILFTRPRDPVPGELRLRWLQELLPGGTVLRETMWSSYTLPRADDPPIDAKP